MARDRDTCMESEVDAVQGRGGSLSVRDVGGEVIATRRAAPTRF